MQGAAVTSKIGKKTQNMHNDFKIKLFLNFRIFLPACIGCYLKITFSKNNVIVYCQYY